MEKGCPNFDISIVFSREVIFSGYQNTVVTQLITTIM